MRWFCCFDDDNEDKEDRVERGGYDNGDVGNVIAFRMLMMETTINKKTKIMMKMESE